MSLIYINIIIYSCNAKFLTLYRIRKPCMYDLIEFGHMSYMIINMQAYGKNR